MSKFQLILLVVFGFFIILGVLIFSGAIKLGTDSGSLAASGEVVIWGTAPFGTISPIIGPINLKNKGVRITYVEKNRNTFDAELLEAIASGNSPDIFFLDSDAILKNKSKIYPVPFASYPQATYQANFVAEADLYLDTSGVLAFPLTLDPLVLYYNTSILDAAGIPSVPQYWDEIVALAPTLTVRDNAGTIVQSTIALGEFDNVSNAKDIFSLLVMQTGNPIVARNAQGKYTSVFRSQTAANFLNPAEESIRFFTDFSNPLKSNYSWNKSLPASQDAFVSGKVAFYIGYASELFTLREKNPNLSFNVAMVPQVRSLTSRLTFGRMTALAVSKTSKNVGSAMTIAGLLTSTDNSRAIINSLALAPVRRDIIATKPADVQYAALFYNAALVSRGWLDPDRQATTALFRTMFNDFLSGRETLGSSINKTNSQLDLLLRNY